MQDLLKPDFGVMLLTVCNFLLLVYLLKRFAWDGLIGALEKREAQIASDTSRAAAARETAEQIKHELEEQLAHISDEAAKKMAEAVKLGTAQRDQLLADGKAQTERMLAQAAVQIAAEKDEALRQVRGEIVRTALLATRQLIQTQTDEQTAARQVDRVLQEIKGK